MLYSAKFCARNFSQEVSKREEINKTCQTFVIANLMYHFHRRNQVKDVENTGTTLGLFNDILTSLCPFHGLSIMVIDFHFGVSDASIRSNNSPMSVSPFTVYLSYLYLKTVNHGSHPMSTSQTITQAWLICLIWTIHIQTNSRQSLNCSCTAIGTIAHYN